MNQVVRFDTSALNNLNRALIGFDRIFDNFEARLANQIQNNYPPHNVIKVGENEYVIELAVTGFSKEEVTVEVDQNELVIRASHPVEPEDTTVHYLHRGLAARDIDKRFGLTENMEVGQAKIANGLLTVNIKVLVLETPKPRQIPIDGD